VIDFLPTLLSLFPLSRLKESKDPSTMDLFLLLFLVVGYVCFGFVSCLVSSNGMENLFLNGLLSASLYSLKKKQFTKS